ncbi:hypothetical protein HMPREF1508_0634 [Shuttleworthella sp. MSX8B]|nr:hypothetical protein HMPREF1508_0634 [Shuttleworthia sp. MSX8B]
MSSSFHSCQQRMNGVPTPGFQKLRERYRILGQGASMETGAFFML